MRHSFVSPRRLWLVWLALAAIALTTLACGFEGGAFGSTPTPAANQVMVPVVGNAAAAPAAAPNMAQAPAEAILITMPPPGQGARGTLRIEGVSDPALAQQLNVVVRDAQGTVIATSRPTSQASADQRSAFVAEVAIPADVAQQTGRVQVYAVSPSSNAVTHLASVCCATSAGMATSQASADQRSAFVAEVAIPADVAQQTGRVQVYAVSPSSNAVTHLASVEVELNSDKQIKTAPLDPQTPEAIAMIFPSPNAEVKGVVRVAAATMLGPQIVVEVLDANNQSVGRMEQAVPVNSGAPAQIMVEVPIKVTTAGPGRVLVYALSARDGATEHLSSVEVNLMP